MWTLRTIKVKYKQSFLGAAWAVLQPLALMVVFSVVFSIFVRVPTGDIPYPVFSYCALLPWTFFNTSISFGTTSLTSNMNLVTKIYFPREVLPIAVVIASLLDYAIGFVVFIGMLLFYRIPITPYLLLVPLLIVIQIALTLGIVFLTSSINVFFRDIQFVIPLLIMVLMYATPIVYPVSLVPKSILWLYMLNPLAVLIEAYRAVTVSGVLPNGIYIAEAALLSLALMLAGFVFFKKVEWQFADLI